jgi:hypothetical protein
MDLNEYHSLESFMTVQKLFLSSNEIIIAHSQAGMKRKFHPLSMLVLPILLLAGLGSYLAYRTFMTQAQPATEIYAIDQTIPTSFGTFVVSEADDLKGLTSQDLAGVTHGIQNLVLADKSQIEVTLALINGSGSPVAYSPDQFKLTPAQGGKSVSITGATMKDGELPPRSNIGATLTFVVPRDGTAYILEFTDPGNHQVLRVDLGKVDQVPLDVLQHLHDH